MFFVKLFLSFKKKLGRGLNPELEFLPRLKALFAKGVVIFVGLNSYCGKLVRLLDFKVLINELTQIYHKLLTNMVDIFS